MDNGSCVVNVSSVFGLVGRPYAGVAYETSKGALIPFTRSAARALAPRGIRVNAVCPGMIRTPMTEALFAPDAPVNLLSDIPLGRPVGIADIVDAICFLASPVSSYVTGATLTVDGGLSAS
jgi:NAD(P)-dependent dehydrogenase (short-subunit alcohol dehydrogenase family)